MCSAEDEDITDDLLNGGSSLLSCYLAALPSNEAEALISSVPVSEQVDRFDFLFAFAFDKFRVVVAFRYSQGELMQGVSQVSASRAASRAVSRTRMRWAPCKHQAQCLQCHADIMGMCSPM